MYFRFTLFNVITMLVMAATIFMVYVRFRFRLENNWLLIYYGAIIGFWRGFPYSLATPWVLFGVACALLLRFEFLGGVPLKILRGLDILFYGYVLWRGWCLLAGW